jgi:hypothetical protein
LDFQYLERSEKSLETLASRFMESIKKKKADIIDISWLSQVLKVQRRRIYDITNVLEGIGVLSKNGKNRIKWVFDHISDNDLEVLTPKVDVELKIPDETCQTPIGTS